MTARGPTFVSAIKDLQTTPLSTASILLISAQVLKHGRGHMEARQVHLGPYWENEVKCVINILKGSLSAGINDVPELIVKIMSSVYLYSFGPYIPFNFSNWIFSWYPKNS